MKVRIWKSISSMAVVALVVSIVPAALGQCGLPSKTIKPSGWHPQFGAATPKLVRAALEDRDDHDRDDRDRDDRNHNEAIVGMWHVLFTAQTANGEPVPVPGGIVIDNAIAVWHNDGTEIMNSARSAQDGNFCLGVWERTGERTYLLNHIPWQGNVYDPSASPSIIGPPQSGVQIIEKITLSPDGNSFKGTFTLKAYDTSGNVYTSFTGELAARRIIPETPFSSLL